jgi:hypothetical protein
MNRYRLIIAVLLVPALVHASQFLFSVQLKKDDCVIFKQNGEMLIQPREENGLNDFDFGLVSGDCPTVCGANCPLDILSKSEFYIYKTNPEIFPLFGQSINFANSEFNTTSNYQHLDSLKFYTIPTEKFQKYYVFKTVFNKYALFIIDSLKTHDACPYPIPCCNATTIECIYGMIILQSNGLPQFDIPVPVAEKKFSNSLKTSPMTYQTVDIQGRILLRNTRATAGVRLIVKRDGVTDRIVVSDHSGMRTR